jgi:hypothetical protein
MSLTENFKAYIQQRISKTLNKPVEDIDFSSLLVMVTTEDVGWNSEVIQTVLNVTMKVDIEGEVRKGINFNISLSDVDFLVDDILTEIARG